MKLYFIALLFFWVPFFGQSQLCIATITPGSTSICPGDMVDINAIANLLSNDQISDFNSGALPPGWSTSGSATYSEPCSTSPSATPYYWAGTTSSSLPQIETAALDITCGGVITFDMVFAIQGQSFPCEGPELDNEGVSLQYSLDGGTTWTTIVYYNPDGNEYPVNNFSGIWVVPASNITNYTSWSSFTVEIPTGALSTSTMFRWIQENTDGESYDNWGLDNIAINASGSPCGAGIELQWSNGFLDILSFSAPFVADTFFVLDVYDNLGNYQCSSDTFFINIYTGDNIAFDLVDTVFAYCLTDSILAEILNFTNGQTPFTTDWSTGSTTNPTLLGTNGNKQDTIHYYVNITDGCGYGATDSVVMIVNQTLQIDTIMQSPPSSCKSDGVASVEITGETALLGQPIYIWTQSNPPGPYSMNGKEIDSIPSDWYYFTVSDDVCQEIDSIFVEQPNPPPAAELTVNTDYGCAPLKVSFTNNSNEYSETFNWDFGNGNSITVDNTNALTETFLSTSTVTLIAYDKDGCPSDASVTITVDPCGCTDPKADNYNPIATDDDGSCTYPFPTVIAPNIFTPNGDGDNDLFFLDVTDASNVDLVILNRWGNVIFQSSGPNPAWDGTTEGGGISQEGTYFFKYTVTGFQESDQINGHGFFQLMID